MQYLKKSNYYQVGATVSLSMCYMSLKKTETVLRSFRYLNKYLTHDEQTRIWMINHNVFAKLICIFKCNHNLSYIFKSIDLIKSSSYDLILVSSKLNTLQGVQQITFGFSHQTQDFNIGRKPIFSPRLCKISR